MAKLGKKARKFAKKNLQSVLKRKRKLKSFFKRKDAKKEERRSVKDVEGKDTEKQNERSLLEDIGDISIDAVFGDNDNQGLEDDSDSDGYLSEESASGDVTETETDGLLRGDNSTSMDAMSLQNKGISAELKKNKKKLDRLKEKDPEFVNYLETHDNGTAHFSEEDDYSDEDETGDHPMEPMAKADSFSTKRKLFTSSVFVSTCRLVTEQNSVPALTTLLNGYRAACHYGTEQSGIIDLGLYYEIVDRESYSKILIFVLQKADGIFRNMLGISGTSCKKDRVVELKNTSKWNNLKPLIKSYLRSTLFLLNQATDSEILAFSLTQLRASIIFFAPFPNLLQRLIKTTVHLWVTGQGILSQHSFLCIKDVASIFNSDCFDTCFIETYKGFIRQCEYSEPVASKHFIFLRNSLVELCSQDMQKSYTKAMVSIQQLARMLQLAIRKKKKEALKKIYSGQFTKCIDLWVNFISANVRDYDLQALSYTIIQIINGIACMFSGPRYLPLRVKCIQWLNHLSSSSGTFIPITSLILDILEYKTGKDVGKNKKKKLEASSAVKLPKTWLKSQNFQDQCVLSVIELLAVHFSQWSHHISFPELAHIPIMRLRKFVETTTSENLRRMVKRFIEQVELNIGFVERKRDEAAFSPKDQQYVETFLQLEKSSCNASYMQYYKSIIEKAGSKILMMNEKISSMGQKNKRGKF